MAPRVPIPLREVVYTLSPYQQEIQLGAQKARSLCMRKPQHNSTTRLAPHA